MKADFSELIEHSAKLGEVSGAARKAAGLAVRKATADVVAHAKIAAPVDTGNLRGAIHATYPDELTGEAISPVHYSTYQEYGTRFQPGTPHMRPALAKVAPSFEAAIAQLAERSI